jgi:hypothetical protein
MRIAINKILRKECRRTKSELIRIKRIKIPERIVRNLKA